MSRVVTFGELMLRLEPPAQRRLVQSLPGPLEATFAGAEANVALAVSLLGGSSEFVSAIPDNLVGEALVRELRGNGVRTDHILRIAGARLGTFYSERGANQRPSVVVYDREHSALAETDASEYDWDAAFADADWFHVTGITPAVSKNGADATAAAVEKAAATGLTISCDLNFRGTLWRWESGTKPQQLAQRVMPPILEHATLIIGNEGDAHDVLGIEPPSSDVDRGEINHEGYLSVARQVAERFPKTRFVAFTLRESVSASHNRWGAMLYDRAEDQAIFAPRINGSYTPYEITDIVDRVGAGDSFAGSLIWALRNEMKPRLALEFAVGYSCLAHSISGDINYTSVSDVERLLASGGSGRVQR